MREPSLGLSAFFSALIHASILTGIILISMKNTPVFHIPSPYFVDIVGPIEMPGNKGTSTTIQKAEKKTAQPVAKQAIVPRLPQKEVTKDQNAENAVEGEISRLKAIKRIQELERLRKIITLGRSQNIPQTGASGTGEKGSESSGTYIDLVRHKIWAQWAFSGPANSNLETIVSIRILKDGRIVDKKIEKSSGDPLFDTSALRAIAKANPLPPIPGDTSELDIGVRFTP